MNEESRSTEVAATPIALPSFFIEIVTIDFGNTQYPSIDTNLMVDHPARQARPIDENDAFH